MTIPTNTISVVVESAAHGAFQIFVSKPGEDDLFIGTIQLADYTPEDDDPVLATKVGDMVIFDTGVLPPID